MRILLKDLAPNANYYLQFRPRGANELMDWSPKLNLLTTSESMEAPSAPTWPIVWATTETDLSNRYIRRVNVNLNWNPNSEIDLDSYVIQYKRSTDSAWIEVRVLAPATSTRIDGLNADAVYNFRIAAKDRWGNVSEFTNAPADLTTGADASAPNVPSAPDVSNYIGNLLVTWDGKADGGGSMSSDTERVEVHVSEESGFIPTSSTMKTYFSSAYSGKPQSAIVGGLLYDTTYYVKLVAADYSNNLSASSLESSGVPQKAGEDDISSINAGQIDTGELAAGVRIIAGPEFGTHTELTSTGLRVYAEDPTDGVPNEVIRMGTDTNDYFGITNSNGALLAAIDQEGRGSFSAVNTPSLILNGDDITTYFEDSPRGTVARAYYEQGDGPNTISGAERGWLEIAFKAQPGRLYKIAAHGIHVTTTAANTRAAVTLRKSSDGSTPSITSTKLVENFTTALATGASTSIIVEALYSSQTGTEETVRVLLSYRRITGTGEVGTFNDSTGRPVHFWVEDIGKFVGNAFQRNDGGISGGTVPPAVKQTYTKDYPALWSATYSDGSGNGKLTYHGSEMVHGQGKFGMCGFDDAQVRADLAGATIEYVKVAFYANHWYYNNGGIARLGYHGQSVEPATGSYVHIGENPGSGTVYWEKPGLRWTTMPGSVGTGLASGTVRGFTVGGGAGGDLRRYGRFNGNGMSWEPVVRIKYTK